MTNENPMFNNETFYTYCVRCKGENKTGKPYIVIGKVTCRCVHCHCKYDIYPEYFTEVFVKEG